MRLCADCEQEHREFEAAIGGFDAPGRSPDYRGTVALGLPLPGWPTDICLLAMDIWDRFFELRTVEVPGPNPPTPHPRAFTFTPFGEQPPRQWRITTDTGSVHHGFPGGGHGAGGGAMQWHQMFAPSLPEHTTTIDVFARAPGATSTTTAAITGWPATILHWPVVPDDNAPPGDPSCPSCGPPPDPPQDSNNAGGLELQWAMDEPPPGEASCFVEDNRPLCEACRSALGEALADNQPTSAAPDGVIPLSAGLGRRFGSHLFLLSIELWPTWFDLQLSGDRNGPWPYMLPSPRWQRWSARDDRGAQYVGAQKGGSSDPHRCNIDLRFVPALSPGAEALTLVFPASFGDGTVLRTTIELPRSD